MTIQIKKTASEQTLLVSKSINKSNKFFVDYLLYNSDLSPAVKSEIRLFIKRNKIVKSEFCLRCLKAYLINQAKQSMNVLMALSVEEIIPHETGHNGYFLDEGEAIKI